MKSALILAPEPPYPIAGGGALRTASLLHYLAQSHQIHLILFRQPNAPDPSAAIPANLIHRLTILNLPHHRATLPARAARNAARLARRIPPLTDRFAGFDSQIAEAIQTRTYHLALVEHSWAAPYHAVLAAHSPTTILDLHNIESALHAACAASEPAPQSLAHRAFHRAALRLEQTWLPRFSQVLTASASDAAAAQAIAPTARIHVYPNAIPARPPLNETRRPVVAFSGNMEYHPNLAAVRFFRHEIWPLLRARHPNLVWRLIGKNPEAVHRYTAGDPRIEVTGPVDDAVLELARAQIAVVPLLAGSGTRLKILEAWAAGTPVVSTPIGAEGLNAQDGLNLLLAATPTAFAEAVDRLIACNVLSASLAAEARLLLEKEFTWEKAWQRLAF